MFQVQVDHDIFGLVDISDAEDEAVAMLPGDLLEHAISK